jgi:predicted RNA binding protein YcfA (HicA-like mRNA interferase family)
MDMSKQEKLRERLKNNPNNATFSDIRKLLEREGFELDRVTGSHHIFIKQEITFVVPVHNNKVKIIYVKKVIELIEQVDSQVNEEEQP